MRNVSLSLAVSSLACGGDVTNDSAMALSQIQRFQDYFSGRSRDAEGSRCAVQGGRSLVLGELTPPSSEDHVALLTLSTKTYSALCYLKDASAAEEVLSVGAEHTASIHVHSPLGGSDGARGSTPMSTVRVVLAHYTTRITLSVKSGKMGVAEWIKNKVKAELLGLLKEREVSLPFFKDVIRHSHGFKSQICKLASTAFEAGRWLLASKSQKAAESTGVEDRDPASALPWLLWALELLEGVAGDESRHMRVGPFAGETSTTLTSLADHRSGRARRSVSRPVSRTVTHAKGRGGDYAASGESHLSILWRYVPFDNLS